MEGGVLVEMVYSPLITALMEVAGGIGDGGRVGTDVLKKQAYHQFSMWTGRRASGIMMAGAMENNRSEELG